MSQNLISAIPKLVQLIEETVSQGMRDSSQVMSYLQECGQLGVEVLPFDLNRSEANCVLEEEKNIRLGFSLLAPKNPQMIEDVLAERQQHGPFRSFQDFCERIELELVPEDVITRWIQAGAFDAIEASRARLCLGQQKIIQAVRKAKSEKSTGQISLFAMLPPSPKTAIALPDAEEWTEAEIIAHEKEAVGFSFTEYLLQREIEEAAEAAFPELPELVEKRPDSALIAENALLENREQPTTVQPETSLPIVPEPVVAEPIVPEPVVVEPALPPIQVTAPEELEAAFLPKDEVEKPEDAPSSEKETAPPPPSTVYIQLSTSHTTEQTLLHLREIVQKHPGNARVILEFHDGNHQPTQVRTHPDYAVAISTDFINAVETITGANTTRLQAVMAQP